jgi:hypothetical protein
MDILNQPANAAETTETKPRTPLQAAHPQAPSQPVLVADQLTGTPVWIYPNTPEPAPPPRVDPMAQRIIAAGCAAPLIGWGGSMFFGAMAGATTGLGYAAVCCASAALIKVSAGGKGSGANVNIRIDNRGR